MLLKFQSDYVLGFPEPQDALEALENLPTDMDSAYDEVLERVEKVKAKATVIKVLSWVFYAQRPLHMSELREAMSIRPLRETKLFSKLLIHPDSLVSSCQGLITVDEETDVVRFTHYTVYEFLQKKFLTKLLSFIDLAKVCLTYLTLDVFEQGPSTNEESFHNRMKEHKFTFYAVRFWGHYTRGAAEKDPEVRVGLFNLLKSTYKMAALRQVQLVDQRGMWTQDVAKLLPTDLMKWTAMHIVAQEGLLTIFELLCSDDTISTEIKESRGDSVFGAVNSKDHDASTPLNEASKQGHTHLVRALLRNGADISTQTKCGRWTAIHSAVLHGHYDTFVELLAQGSNLEVQTASGWTPLHCASQLGHINILRALLKSHIDLTALTNGGWTALHCAAQSGHKNIVEELLDNEMDSDIQDSIGWTALHRAVWAGHWEVVELLLRRGANVNQKTICESTPLHWAAYLGHAELIRLLLQYGANTKALDRLGQRACDLATANAHHDVVAILAQHNLYSKAEPIKSVGDGTNWEEPESNVSKASDGKTGQLRELRYEW